MDSSLQSIYKFAVNTLGFIISEYLSSYTLTAFGTECIYIHICTYIYYSVSSHSSTCVCYYLWGMLLWTVLWNDYLLNDWQQIHIRLLLTNWFPLLLLQKKKDQVIYILIYCKQENISPSFIFFISPTSSLGKFMTGQISLFILLKHNTIVCRQI